MCLIGTFFVAPSRLRLLCSSTPRQASLSGLIGGRRSPFCLCIFYAWGVQSSSVLCLLMFFAQIGLFDGSSRSLVKGSSGDGTVNLTMEELTTVQPKIQTCLDASCKSPDPVNFQVLPQGQHLQLFQLCLFCNPSPILRHDFVRTVFRRREFFLRLKHSHCLSRLALFVFVRLCGRNLCDVF